MVGPSYTILAGVSREKETNIKENIWKTKSNYYFLTPFLCVGANPGEGAVITNGPNRTVPVDVWHLSQVSFSLSPLLFSFSTRDCPSSLFYLARSFVSFFFFFFEVQTFSLSFHPVGAAQEQDTLLFAANQLRPLVWLLCEDDDCGCVVCERGVLKFIFLKRKNRNTCVHTQQTDLLCCVCVCGKWVVFRLGWSPPFLTIARRLPWIAWTSWDKLAWPKYFLLLLLSLSLSLFSGHDGMTKVFFFSSSLSLLSLSSPLSPSSLRHSCFFLSFRKISTTCCMPTPTATS